MPKRDVIIDGSRDTSGPAIGHLAELLAERYGFNLGVVASALTKGRRIRVRQAADDASALRLKNELEAMGARVSLVPVAGEPDEPHRPEKPADVFSAPLSELKLSTLDGADDDLGPASSLSAGTSPLASGSSSPAATTTPATPQGGNRFAPPEAFEQELELAVLPTKSRTLSRPAPPAVARPSGVGPAARTPSSPSMPASRTPTSPAMPASRTPSSPSMPAAQGPVPTPLASGPGSGPLSARVNAAPEPPPGVQTFHDPHPEPRRGLPRLAAIKLPSLGDPRFRLVAGLALGLLVGFFPAHLYGLFAEDKLDAIRTELVAQPPPQTDAEYDLALHQFTLAHDRMIRVRDRIAIVAGFLWLLSGGGITYAFGRFAPGHDP